MSNAKRTRESRLKRTFEAVRRAYAEFLTIPSIVIILFVGMGAGVYFLDRLRIERGWATVVPGTHESIATLLGTIAGSIITVTSITFSLLLIAVQQSAAALTGQVYDQFLRRRDNQFYFGFFIGLALYCLVVLATVRPDYTPVYGATLAFALTAIALFMLVLLIYSTIDQMRPVMILRAIRGHTLNARAKQKALLAATRAVPSATFQDLVRISSAESGFLTSIDVPRLQECAKQCAGGAEIVILRCIGDYVSVGEELIEVRLPASGQEPVRDELFRSALVLETKRDLATDPGFGIEQLETIAWTTVSTSKQNPQPGRLACWALRDLVAEWYRDGAEGLQRGGPDCRVVLRDRVPAHLIRAFETLAVVASESMQHHVLAEVYVALALALRRTQGELREEVEGAILRSLSLLGDHGLTAQLDESLVQILSALPPGRTQAAVKRARDQLAGTWGVLNSRSTRVANSRT